MSNIKDEIEIVWDADPVDVTLAVQDALDRYALIPDDSDVVVDTSANTVTSTPGRSTTRWSAPPRACPVERVPWILIFDAGRYKERNTVERCFSKLKQFRAVATRYDKRQFMYQGTVDIASIRIWLRDPVP